LVAKLAVKLVMEVSSQLKSLFTGIILGPGTGETVWAD